MQPGALSRSATGVVGPCRTRRMPFGALAQARRRWCQTNASKSQFMSKRKAVPRFVPEEFRREMSRELLRRGVEVEDCPLSAEEVQALKAGTGSMQTVADQHRSGMELGPNPQI